MGQSATPVISDSVKLVLNKSVESATPKPLPVRFLSRVWQYGPVLLALLFLLVGAAAIKVGGNYWSDRVVKANQPIYASKAVAPTIAGLNLTMPASEFQSRLKTITHQPVTLTVGDQTTKIDAGTIRDWLKVTANADKSEYYIRVKAGAIAASLKQTANQYVQAPINRVTVSEDGVKQVVYGGQNGIALTNPDSLKIQANEVAKTVMDGKGLKFSTPLKVQAFQSVTPAAFDKLIVVNTTAKKMWLFENGKQVKAYLVSAGAPATPTPWGFFHIYAKLTVQDMRGLNTDGSRYFQPHVYWVNYFTGGNAIHGVYWHPLSWFGAINSSHGCVGIPDNEAEWVYNWAPMDTPVIVHG